MESFGWARFGVEVTVSSSPWQVAVANLSEAVQDADLLVFVIPHQFIHRICDEITGRVPKEALGITLIKGIDEGPEGLKLISDIIREKMGIDISVLMGANIASEVAAEKFCETTIGEGCWGLDMWCFNTDSFHFWYFL